VAVFPAVKATAGVGVRRPTGAIRGGRLGPYWAVALDHSVALDDVGSSSAVRPNRHQRERYQEPEHAHHHQDHAGGLNVDTGDGGCHRELENRAKCDQEKGRADVHIGAIPVTQWPQPPTSGEARECAHAYRNRSRGSRLSAGQAFARLLDRNGNGIISSYVSDENIDPEVTKALDERIDWINSVEAAERKHGVKALQKAIDELDDEHLRFTLFVLMSLRVSDRKAIEEVAARQARSKGN
jgi:hypothetical protein